MSQNSKNFKFGCNFGMITVIIDMRVKQSNKVENQREITRAESTKIQTLYSGNLKLTGTFEFSRQLQAFL